VIIAATIIIMLATAWAQYRNGLFSAWAMLFKVVIAGLVAFNFFEPIADALEPSFQSNALAGCEDFLVLTTLFAVTALALRVGTNYLAPDIMDQHGALQHFGAAAVGLGTGYLLAGFMLCSMQTLPLDERFLDFAPRETNENPLRTVFPSDRIWLTMMRHAGDAPLNWKEDPTAEAANDRPLTFDRHGTFELRYLRFRRNSDARPAMRYQGEFDVELGKKAKAPPP
jgi:hypothetical protein